MAVVQSRGVAHLFTRSAAGSFTTPFLYSAYVLNRPIAHPAELPQCDGYGAALVWSGTTLQ